MLGNTYSIFNRQEKVDFNSEQVRFYCQLGRICVSVIQYCSLGNIYAPGSQLLLRQHSHHIWKCQRQSVHVQVQFVPLSAVRESVHRVAPLWGPSMRRGEAVLSAGEYQYQFNAIVVLNSLLAPLRLFLTIQDSMYIKKHWIWTWSKWRHTDHGVSSQRYLTCLLLHDSSLIFKNIYFKTIKLSVYSTTLLQLCPSCRYVCTINVYTIFNYRIKHKTSHLFWSNAKDFPFLTLLFYRPISVSAVHISTEWIFRILQFVMRPNMGYSNAMKHAFALIQLHTNT